MKDVSGQELQLGDKVAISGSVSSAGGMGLYVGNIIRFTNTGCRVFVDREQTKRRYFSDETHDRGHIRNSAQVSFIARDEAFAASIK